MVEEANKWSRQDLLGNWALIKKRKEVSGWAPGKAFEYLVIRAFALEGMDVRWPFEVTYPQRWGTMEQMDGVVYVDKRPFLVESKDMSEPIAIEAIAKLRFRLERRPPGTMALLFSVGGFSTATEVFAQFASPLNVLLWTGSDMDAALRSATVVAGLRQKLAYAIEYGLPLFPLKNAK